MIQELLISYAPSRYNDSVLQAPGIVKTGRLAAASRRFWKDL